MSAVWTSARRAVRVHRGSMAGSAVVVALAAALLTVTGVWIEAGARLQAGSDDPGDGMLLTVASSFAGTAVLIVLLVVGSTFAGALRPRAREFALLRAVGATTAQVRRLVTAEVLLVFALAAPLGIVPGLLLAPLLRPVLAASGVVGQDLEAPLSPWPVLGTLALLVPTALLGARLAGRESARMSPSAAVQRSAAEPVGISRARRLTALVLAAAGLAVAGLPLVLPGVLGAAGAATSAILLLVAAALAGPVLVRAVAQRALDATAGRPRGVLVLAFANARGFSRRLTGAVVPLALLLALGVVQSGADGALVAATEQQVRQSLAADLVAPLPGGDPAAAPDLADVPGVAAAGVTQVHPAQVRLEAPDPETPAFLDDLDWEAAGLRTVPDGDLLDPGVTKGSLADLAGDRTIAVARDTALTGGAGLGDPVLVRVDGEEMTFTVVALFERGLGLGDYLVGPDALPGSPAADPTLLVRVTDPGDRPAVRDALVAAGLAPTGPGAYADAVRGAAAGERGLSMTLLLALLAFLAVAAASAVVGLVGTRRPEFALLHRTGATRRQLRRMVAVESAVVAGTALVVGVLCAVPAVLGLHVGLLGTPVPTVDLGLVLPLVAVVVLVGAVLPVLAAGRATTATRVAVG